MKDDLKGRIFRIFLVVDVLICIITLVFFVIGLADGSVSSFNIGIWVIAMAVLAVIMAVGFTLKQHGHPVIGTIVLLILAVPGLLYVLFIVLFVVSGASWN